MNELHVKAPAKINLRLEVLGKRPDGYHEVRLLMVAISLFDDIALKKRDGGIALSCPGLEEGPGNLAWRAADLYFSESGVRGGVDISVQKNTPVAAGLGGGSSDAAAVLEGLDRLYETGIGAARLREWGARLGSDVPFFIGGTTWGWATGRGEIVTPISPPKAPLGVVLANPRVGVSTAEVYKALAAPPFISLPGKTPLTPLGADSMDRPLPDALWGEPGKAFLRNDLEPVVFDRYPIVAELKRRLQGAGAAAALMSGSGASVFGLCKSLAEARAVMKAAALPPEYFCCAVETLAAR